MSLIITFSLVSLTLTGITYYFSGLYQNWIWFWTIPLFLYAYFLVAFATWLIFLYVGALFVKEDENYIYKPSRFAQRIVRSTARVCLLILRVKTHMTGLGKIPDHKPVILINNHVSVFDEFAIAAFFPRHLIFISKPGNFRIPIAGAWMRYAGYLPIKQGDMNDGAKIISLAAEYAREHGRSICVAPEGTRNKDFPDPILLPFHAGTFRLAQDSGAPIVVLAIQNTNVIAKRFPRHRTHIYLDVVGVLEKEEYDCLSSREIAEKCRRLVEKRLEDKGARIYHFRKKEKREDEEGADKGE